MSSITNADIVSLAKLARLTLTEEEINRLYVELQQILSYVEQLQEVDTSGLEPTYQVTGLTNVMREDRVVDYGATPAELIKNAPSTENDHFKVNRMIN